MNRCLYRCVSVAAVAMCAATFTLSAQQRRSNGAGEAIVATQTIAQRVASLQKMDGFMPIYFDLHTAHLFIEITGWDKPFLYLRHTATGNGNGVNRGAVAQPLLVHFSRIGPKILLTAENTAWRNTTGEAAQQDAVRDSFAQSVVGGFTIAAEDDDTHVLVDATDFLLRDVVNFAGRLGTGYRLDLTRSSIVPEHTKNFPKNTEVETLLTFSKEAGAPVGPGSGERGNSIAPDAQSVTLRARQSLIELPEPGYKPRVWDQRAGNLQNTSYYDWSKPLGESRETRFVNRFRLQKKNPNAAVSDPVTPITFYVDRGAPEPIRTALLEGARWWSDAFLAAGFSNAFKVELLPEGADPYDIRYNMILWVEEDTRGFSNGLNVVDPRTGEIIKGEVTLTSGRERQDYLITEALLSPYKTGDKPDPQQMAMVLQRIRHLSAHETGHTLGFGHNHAASAFGLGSSIDDYPFPDIRLDANGRIDLSHAYQPGLGEWDRMAVKHTYMELLPNTSPEKEKEKATLDKVIDDGLKKGMYFITDSGPSSIHPHSSQWDNGPDSAAELERLLKVREVAMKNFSEAAIKPGRPMVELQDTLVPVYLLHRYQTEAAAQSIAGEDYRYAVRGDHQQIAPMVPADQQRAALKAILKTLDPRILTLPEALIELFPPRPPSLPRTQESFHGEAGDAFDPMAPVQAATAITLSALLEPTRANRLIEFHARDNAMPGLSEVVDALLQASWYAPAQQGLVQESKLTIDHAVLEQLQALSSSVQASAMTRAVLRGELAKLRTYAADRAKDTALDTETRAFYGAAFDAGAPGGATRGSGTAAPAPAAGPGRRSGDADSIPAGAPI